MRALRQIRRIFNYAAQFAHDCITGEPQFSQDLAGGPHHFRQAVRWDYDQGDDQQQQYFGNAQEPSPTDESYTMIVNPSWGVNNAQNHAGR